jgi:predicted GIY-YIG superfamily endonuclease
MSDTQTTPFVNTPEILYRLRAANGDLLYVGITRDFPSRLKQHYADKPWAYEIRSTEQVHIDGTRAQIEAIEKAVIIAEKPRHNKTHNAEVRRTLAAPAPVAKLYGPLFWREEDDGTITKFYKNDQVFTFGRVATLVDWHSDSADLDYTVIFNGGSQPIRIDGTCDIRHAIPGEQDEVW